MKNKVRHRVILYITHDCDILRNPMTEKGVKRWVKKQFEGCDYGQVEVADVLNEILPEAPLSPKGLPLR